MQLLSDVLKSYLATRLQANGKATHIGNIDQRSILVELPIYFKSLLLQIGRGDEFIVEGSIGNGNMALVPWVGIFNRAVTATAQEVYYIVLLFSETMTSCYLSLNQGVTELKGQFGPAVANSKMRATARRALQFLVTDRGAFLGPIDLDATGSLGKGYENSAIESYRYDLQNLPNQVNVAENFLSLLNHYDRLVAVAGPSLQFLAPISEDEFHQAAMEKALVANLDDDEPDVSLPIPGRSETSRNGCFRSIKFAALALRRAEFKCEIDATHETFLSRASKQYYVEAHHLVPISKQNLFPFSLDVPANIVALCATCHKLLHHGRIVDKRDHLIRLLKERRERLEKMEILVGDEVLLSYYRKGLIDDE